MTRPWLSAAWLTARGHTPAVRCEYLEGEFDCERRATRIGELKTDRVIRIALCRRHGRVKRRDGWYVRRASSDELGDLADADWDGRS